MAFPERRCTTHLTRINGLLPDDPPITPVCLPMFFLTSGGQYSNERGGILLRDRPVKALWRVGFCWIREMYLGLAISGGDR